MLTIHEDSMDISSMRNVSWIHKWGAIVGLIGGTIGAWGGGSTLYDRYTKPDLNIIGAAPVAVWTKVDPDSNQVLYGVSLIVQLQNNGSKPAYVGGSTISGKIYLSYSEYRSHAQMAGDAKPSEEIELEFRHRKPYYLISWSGWLSDQKGPLRVEPDEERFVRFTFNDPINSGNVSWFTGSPVDHVGFEAISKPPKRISHDPGIQFFFKDTPGKLFRHARDLRDEVKNGLVKIEVQVGSKSKIIDPSKLIRRVVTKAAWDNYPARKIYFDID
jgi:hypothetical protein